MERKSGKKRRTNPRILILVEGQTEQYYFQAIKQDPDYKKSLAALTVEVKKSKKQASGEMTDQAVELLEIAKKENNAYNSVWLVFDHDNNPKRKEAWDKAKQSPDNIQVAFSAIAFEQWYLLHFKQSTKACQTAAELIVELKKHLPKYAKAKQNDFSLLKDKLDIARKNAEWLRDQHQDKQAHPADLNPVTFVDLLVGELVELGK
jgi:hypothetical protein